MEPQPCSLNTYCLWLFCTTKAEEVVAAETKWPQNQNIYFLALYRNNLPTPALGRTKMYGCSGPARNLGVWARMWRNLDLDGWTRASLKALPNLHFRALKIQPYIYMWIYKYFLIKYISRTR